MTTYVHEGTEVELTGRTAKKTIKSPTRNRELVLLEITPIDKTFDWKKWVANDQLFEVFEKDSR